MDNLQIPASELTELCILPVGIEHKGQRYRRVYVDEMSGVDEHHMSDKKTADKAMSLLLARCIQEIEGLVERKKDPDTLIALNLVQNMYQVDRDVLVTHIQRLSGTEDATMAGVCPRCDKAYEEFISLGDLDIISWPEDKACEIEFDLAKGFLEKTDKGSVYHKKGKLRFPKGKDQEKLALLEDDSASMFDALFAACILKVGDLEKISQEHAKRLKSRDRAYLSRLFQKELPGLKQWKEHKCSCGRRFDISMDIENFFGQRPTIGGK